MLSRCKDYKVKKYSQLLKAPKPDRSRADDVCVLVCRCVCVFACMCVWVCFFLSELPIPFLCPFLLGYSTFNH